jgi:hypothetical protein
MLVELIVTKQLASYASYASYASHVRCFQNLVMPNLQLLTPT